MQCDEVVCTNKRNGYERSQRITQTTRKEQKHSETLKERKKNTKEGR